MSGPLYVLMGVVIGVVLASVFASIWSENRRLRAEVMGLRKELRQMKWDMLHDLLWLKNHVGAALNEDDKA